MATFRKDRFRRRSTLGQWLIFLGVAMAALSGPLEQLLSSHVSQWPKEIPFVSIGVATIIIGILLLISARHIRNSDRARENEHFNAAFSESGAGALAEGPLVLFLRSRANAERTATKKSADAAARQNSVRNLPRRMAIGGAALFALLAIAGVSDIAGILYVLAIPALVIAWIYSKMFRLTHSVDHHGDCEEDIAAALLNRAHLIAIGDDTQRTREIGTRGALKLVRHHADWKQSFSELSHKACLIIAECGSTEAVIWEIEQIARTPDFSARTIVVLPPGATESDWHTFIGATGEQSELWPPYNALGLACTVPTSDQPAVTVTYGAFLAGLKEIRFNVDNSDPKSLVRDRLASAAMRELRLTQLQSHIRDH